MDSKNYCRAKKEKKSEQGAALAIVIIVTAILAVVTLTALAFSSSEVRIVKADLQRTRTYYATISSIEQMTNSFSDLFRRKMRPTAQDLNDIAAVQPPGLASEGYTFDQKLEQDNLRLAKLQATQGLPSNVYPRVNIPEGPFAGLYATIIPYRITSVGESSNIASEVKLEREFNNYLVPLFQFGMFSNRDIELNPGVQMMFNGRIHSNENIFALGNVKFLNRITMAGELVRKADSGGAANAMSGASNVYMEVAGVNTLVSNGSMQAGGGTVGGPNISGSIEGQRGFFPGRPNGIPTPLWETQSVNDFRGQILTRTTGAKQLKMPIQLEGGSAAELIKRSLPTDSEIVSSSRYQSKAQVRILIDDLYAGNGTANVAGIPAGKGVILKNDGTGFTPRALHGGKALNRVDNFGNYIDTTPILQTTDTGANINAATVRGIKNIPDTTTDYVPPGSGIEAKILIEVVKPDGTAVDVTSEILSMGMTEGEPNGIVYLQRPLWMAYVQGSRDRSGGGFDMVSLTRNTRAAADGEIPDPTSVINAGRGFISTNIGTFDNEPTLTRDAAPTGWQNQIVPINVYNVREGWYQSQMNEYDIYERGMTSVVEINMRNLAKWLDGLYDSNLLAGTPAVSTNIKGDEGYVVYVSDRRGDKVGAEYLSNGTAYLSTNGNVDNEDIYGANNFLDEGEDVIDFGWNSDGSSKAGTLQKNTAELPDTGTIWSLGSPPPSDTASSRMPRANTVMTWINPNNYFRRAVRLFDGETMSFSAASGKLSPTKGITVATENMLYLWGNYNTTGITSIPAGGSTLNEAGGYSGAQIPSSLVCDAVFPLSKTWFDGLSALYPEGSSAARTVAGTAYRMADDNLPSGLTESTSVRAAIIAGTNSSAMTASPGRDAAGLRKAGGTVNFPRFLEIWNLGSGTARPWNYTGSINPLYYSTQAVSQWENSTSVIYTPPIRNWSFDSTYLNPNSLPPGTPFFQFVQATGFRQVIRE